MVRLAGVVLIVTYAVSHSEAVRCMRTTAFIAMSLLCSVLIAGANRNFARSASIATTKKDCDTSHGLKPWRTKRLMINRAWLFFAAQDQKPAAWPSRLAGRTVMTRHRSHDATVMIAAR